MAPVVSPPPLPPFPDCAADDVADPPVFVLEPPLAVPPLDVLLVGKTEPLPPRTSEEGTTFVGVEGIGGREPLGRTAEPWLGRGVAVES